MKISGDLITCIGMGVIVLLSFPFLLFYIVDIREFFSYILGLMSFVGLPLVIIGQIIDNKNLLKR